MQPYKYNPNFNSGTFRHRITIEQLQEVIDPDTDRVKKEWVQVRKLWCAIKTIKGNEYVSSAMEKERMERTYRFIIRYTPNIDNSIQTRINFKGRIFDIESILHDDEAKKQSQLSEWRWSDGDVSRFTRHFKIYWNKCLSR